MITIKTTEKVNPRAPLEPRKIYGVAKASGRVDLRKLANRITKETSLGTPDVMAVIEALLQDIPEYLHDGNIVRLGDFGTFRITVSSEGAATLEEYSINLIKKTNLIFRPGKVLSNLLDNAVFHKED